MDTNLGPTEVKPIHIDPVNPQYPLGYWNWITFAASDFDRSADFYDRILGFMGYRRTMESEGFILWQTLYGAVILKPAVAPAAPRAAGSAGVAEFIFYARRPSDVDRFGKLLNELNAAISDGPRAMPEIMPGMYGVLFTDPDGANLGLVHQPANFP